MVSKMASLILDLFLMISMGNCYEFSPVITQQQFDERSISALSGNGAEIIADGFNIV